MLQQRMGSPSRYALSHPKRLNSVRQVKDLAREPPLERQVHLKIKYFFFPIFPSSSAVPRSCQGLWQGLFALLTQKKINYFFFLLLLDAGQSRSLGFFILCVELQSLPLGRPLGLIFSIRLLWAAEELQFSYSVYFLSNPSKFCLNLFLIFSLKRPRTQE